MIDIQPFLKKLDKLQEYMLMKIDGKGSYVTIDWEWMPKISLEAMLLIWEETGYMMYSKPEMHLQPTCRKLTFEEWLEHQENNNINNLQQ